MLDTTVIFDMCIPVGKHLLGWEDILTFWLAFDLEIPWAKLGAWCFFDTACTKL